MQRLESLHGESRNKLLEGNARDELTDDDFEVNLDAEGELFTHFTIDDAEVVQNGLYNFLKNLNNN